MALLDLPAPYDDVDQLLESGDVGAAAKALAGITDGSKVGDVLRVKIALATSSMPPGMAMQRLVALMREDQNLPGAQTLYREASRLSYDDGSSSMAHSHPPPPIKEREGEPE